MPARADRHRSRIVALSWAVALACALIPLAGCAERAAEASDAAGAAAQADASPASAADAGLPAIEDPEAPPVPLAEAVQGDFEEAILLTGELKAVRATSIVAPETSIFQMRIQFLPEEGTEVKTGDPLVDFDNSALADRAQDLETRILDARTQIAAKQAEIATALLDLELERTQKKHDADRAAVRADISEDVVSRKDAAERRFEADRTRLELTDVEKRIKETASRGKAELDVLVIDKEKLERDLASTRNDLDVLSIKAPLAGLVVYEYREGIQSKFKEGDSVWPGQPIVNLPDLSEMEVLFEVNEVDIPRLVAGMPVAITVDSLPGRAFTGKIVDIPSMAVTRTQGSKVRIFRLRCSLSETLRGEMKPGMSVLGRIDLAPIRNATLVPRASVLERGGRYWMLARDAGGGRPGWVAIEPISRNPLYYRLAEKTS